MAKRWLIPGVLLVVYATMAIVGITWGLPTSRIDPLLFDGGTAWSGERIARLSQTSDWLDDNRGADVDADPVVFTGAEPVDLTLCEADVAAIYRRYRLFTHQPDEMITMMALAGMRPREMHLDPKLYQYGGLFIYPVGAFIGLGGATGLIEVTSDPAYYLDHPGEFGKFYIAARVYVALWGAVGVLVIFAMGSRLGGTAVGVVAALLFTLMPVVVCMAHEAKPHLPGAVLMLVGVWWAMRYVSDGRRRDWVGMCVSCGAALGMVLSSLPIFVLIPLAEVLRGGRTTMTSRVFWKRLLGGAAIGVLVYLATNPYVAINAAVNREVLLSNLSNSTAMYEIGRVGEGVMRVIQLTIEGARAPIVAFGFAALLLGVPCRWRDLLPLLVPAGLVFVQFILLGAGKPAEYGRFGVFPNTALAIMTACLVAGGIGRRGVQASDDEQARRNQSAHTARRGGVTMTLASMLVILATGYCGWGYLYNFWRDTAADNTREQFGPVLERFATRDADDGRLVVCVLADPAPYCLPPMNFAKVRLLCYPSMEAYQANPQGVLVVPADTNTAQERKRIPPLPDGGIGSPPYSIISWANKPMVLRLPAQ